MTVSRFFVLSLVATFAPLAGCVKENLQTFAYAPAPSPESHSLTVFVASECPSVGGVEVIGDRETGDQVGTRVAERDGSSADVTLAGDLNAWTKSTVETILEQAGIAVGDEGPTLRVRLNNVRLHESVFVKSGYEAVVQLDVELVRADAVCWSQESVVGRGGNWGNAGNSVNYDETLAEAVSVAMERVLASREFAQELCSCR